MGPDGHTCSLFPGHRLMTESAIDSAEHSPTWPRVVAITDSPKPPAARITLGLAEIQHNALTVVYVTTGKGKAPVLGEIMTKGEKSGYPAAIARPLEGLKGEQRKLVWMVDEEAAGEVPVAVREKLAGKL
ncbi:hypothetical protein BCR44DRAFT_1442418 [Catenaria anguillulae PL171]|uniref:Glucosamine/galactosamine-6-phosphate isomerase domain-containing protein n=1 Tax=Catenaria anguillulae PL171 TaxID=765915 RepID=A0A1Y2HBH3_9FUNG|nr:hypothetical protein BCR44DRAFT_1442418 [Catenaria anguillulae PL171]